MNDDDKAAPALTTARTADPEMRQKMNDLIDEIIKTTAMGVWLWGLVGVIGVVNLVMGLQGQRAGLVIMSIAGIIFSIWNVMNSMASLEKTRAWRRDWNES